MPSPNGFAWSRRRSGDVVITHHGSTATVLRGLMAEKFATQVPDLDEAGAQELMARATGNYKRGNERRGYGHPRNR